METTSSSYLLNHLEDLLLVAVHVCVCADLCHVDAFPVSKRDNLVERENQIKCLRRISASLYFRYQGGHWLLLTKQGVSQWSLHRRQAQRDQMIEVRCSG
jgi:hypothetical protein